MHSRFPAVVVLAVVCSVGTGIAWPSHTRAEWYVAGQVGPVFADKLANINGTGSTVGFVPVTPDFDLKNSIAYGAKLGYFPANGWFGLEGEAFNTTPHVKQLGDQPGIHLRVTTFALNLIARYPGLTFQPYAGVGFGIVFSHLGGTATTQSDSDTSAGLNLLAGLRFFVTPYVSMFTEYKYLQARLTFDRAFGPGGGFSGDYRAQYLMVGVAYHF